MILLKNWRAEFSRAASDLLGDAQSHGVHNCAQMAAFFLSRMTGEDVLLMIPEEFRAPVADLPTDLTREDIIAMLDDVLERKPLSCLGQGDIVVLKNTPAIGVVQGRMIYVLSPSGKIGAVGMKMADVGYKVAS